MSCKGRKRSIANYELPIKKGELAQWVLPKTVQKSDVHKQSLEVLALEDYVGRGELTY